MHIHPWLLRKVGFECRIRNEIHVRRPREAVCLSAAIEIGIPARCSPCSARSEEGPRALTARSTIVGDLATTFR